MRDTVQSVRPTFIAEEDSVEALTDRQEVSIAKVLAHENGIEHRYCDPTREERQAIGYKDGQSIELEIFMHGDAGLSNDEIKLQGRAIEIGRYFPIREAFWLERLAGCRNCDAIFICGDGHIESFGKLLQSNDVRYTVVKRGIGLTDEDKWFDKAVQYLNEHPELGID